MADLVSIVIPIYKVEKFLARCVDSALAQTYTPIEVILVDDGSPDACPQICDEYAARDARVKVVHKPNGGLSSARNAGMQVMRGEYVLFIDSDDRIDPDMVSDLVEIATREQVDFVRTRMKYKNWPNHPDGEACDFGIERGMTEGVYDRARIEREILPRLIATPQLTFGPIVSACATLYRTALLREQQAAFYEDVRYSEDCIFNAKVVWNTQSFYYVNERQYYHYFYNDTSITKSFRADRWDAAKSLIRHFEEDFAGKTAFGIPDQLWCKRMFCVLNTLGERKNIADMKQRVAFCKTICEDPVTVEAMRHIALAQVPWKLKTILWLIRFKQANLLARIG